MAMHSKTQIQIDVTCEAVRYVSLLKRPARSRPCVTGMSRYPLSQIDRW